VTIIGYRNIRFSIWIAWLCKRTRNVQACVSSCITWIKTSLQDATSLLSIKIDHSSVGWLKKRSHIFREPCWGQTTKEGVYSRYETEFGSFTKNWHSSNQLTGLSFPRIKRGRARARKVVYFWDSVVFYLYVTKSFRDHLLLYSVSQRQH